MRVNSMVMPKGINGRQTYEEIIKIRPGQKAIIASGYAKTKKVNLAQELGAGKYIKKPYTLEKVGLAVKEELEKQAVFDLQPDVTFPILLFFQSFFAKRECYGWQPCIALADVRCYIYARYVVTLVMLCVFNSSNSYLKMKYPYNSSCFGLDFIL